MKNLYLEESLQPPHLENALADKECKLEDAPPFHTRVCAFGCVSVDSFSYDNVGLLIADLSQGIGKTADYQSLGVSLEKKK